MSKKSIILLLFVLAVIAVAAYYVYQREPEPEIVIDSVPPEASDEMEDKMNELMEKPDESTLLPLDDTRPADGEKPPVLMYKGTLEDVTGGNAEGSVEVSQAGKTYLLNAQFSNLPMLPENYFFEGWIVRKSPMSVLSTGPLEKETEDAWSNVWMSEEDLFDHDFYVLTLEPDDGDPEPAEHILEGTLTKVDN